MSFGVKCCSSGATEIQRGQSRRPQSFVQMYDIHSVECVLIGAAEDGDDGGGVAVVVLLGVLRLTMRCEVFGGLVW